MFLKAQLRNTVYRYASFKVGDRVTIAKKITRDDVSNFGKLTGDTNPVHFPDDQVGIVHGALLNGFVSGIIGTQLPGPGTLVVSQTLNFPNKCFVDETVNFSVELVELRKIISIKFICEVKDKDKIVMYGDAKLIKK